MTSKLWLPSVLLACCAAGAAPPMSPTPATESPLPALSRLFSGHWMLRVTFEAASGLPHGTEGTGEETWRDAVNGKTLLAEESWKAGPVDMSLLGIFWWSAKDARLHAMDCNNQGKSVCDPQDAADAVQVRWDGKALTIEEPEPGPDGKMVTSRVTYKDITPSSFTETDSIEVAPGRFETMMTIHATRAAR